MPAFAKCECVKCGQPIEYPLELAGQTIDCPTCSQPLIMPEIPYKNHEGIFRRLVERYKAVRQRSANRKDFRNEFLKAVADGVLTDEEIGHLVDKEREFGLDDHDIGPFRIEVFSAAWAGARRTGPISPEQESSLARIQAYLRIPNEKIKGTLCEITRSRRLHDIQQGNIFPIEVSNVILKNDEQAYWTEYGTLYEERVVSRHYESGSSGVSIRVMRGVSFRVGAHRGQLFSETGNVPISAGQLVITNARLVFTGDRKSFATDFDKIVDVQPALDGIRFSEKNKQKPKTILYLQPNGDYVCEILSHFLSKRGFHV